jgi:hypothetical protein
MDYSSAENTVYLDLRGVRLETRDEIDRFFTHATAEFGRITGGQKAWLIVGYDGFVLNLRENDYYMATMRAAMAAHYLGVVRYGGDGVQRAAARTRAIKTHTGSNLYASREEARSVVRGLRDGTIQSTDR